MIDLDTFWRELWRAIVEWLKHHKPPKPPKPPKHDKIRSVDFVIHC